MGCYTMARSTTKKAKKPRDRTLSNLNIFAGISLTVTLIIPIVSGILMLIYAGLLAQIIGNTITQNLPLSASLHILIFAVVILTLRAFISYLADILGQKSAETLKLTLRNILFTHIVNRQSTLGLNPATGAITSTLLDQIEALEAYYARYLPAMVGAAVLPIVFALIMFSVDWIVAVLFLVTAPLIPVFMALAGLGAQAATDRQANALTRLSAHFTDRLRGLLTLKLYGQQEQAIDDVYVASETLRIRTNTVLRIAFLSSATLEFFSALGVAGVALYIGLTFLGLLPFHPELTLTAGMFALIMAPEVYQPLRTLAAHYHDRANAKSAIEQINLHITNLDALLTQTTEPAATASNSVRTSLSTGNAASLEIQNLTVRTASQKPILKSLNLNIPAGQHLAIMGASGSGKTTLARAIFQLITYEGDIRFNGQQLSQQNSTDLHSFASFITQKPYVFHGSIADNIGFASNHPTPQKIQTAAEKAHITSFAPDLNLRLGDTGHGLSGGQIQRVGLARLFMTSPDLIILDEPTTHLDPVTEELVLKEIFSFAEHKTLIILTHSQAIANRCNRIVTLKDGAL